MRQFPPATNVSNSPRTDFPVSSHCKHRVVPTDMRSTSHCKFWIPWKHKSSWNYCSRLSLSFMSMTLIISPTFEIPIANWYQLIPIRSYKYGPLKTHQTLPLSDPRLTQSPRPASMMQKPMATRFAFTLYRETDVISMGVTGSGWVEPNFDFQIVMVNKGSNGKWKKMATGSFKCVNCPKQFCPN